MDITVVAIKEGGLVDEFRAIADQFYHLGDLPSSANHLSNTINYYVLTDVMRRYFKKKTIQSLAKNGYDLIYANTAVTLPLAIQIKFLSATNTTKVLAHIHELDTLLQLLVPDFKSYITHVDHFITAAKIVQENLINRRGVLKNKTSVIYEYSEVADILMKNTRTKSHFKIGASGSATWRKGVDIFLQIALNFKQKYPNLPVQFEWVGQVTTEQNIKLQADLKKADLTHLVQFVGQQINPHNYYQDFDVFLLPSREDPFPLVAIETGRLGKPMLCFEGATGTAEILKNGGGFIVPYLDVAAMVAKIKYYYDHPTKLAEDGQVNANQFARFTPRLQCPKVYQIIEDLVKKSN